MEKLLINNICDIWELYRFQDGLRIGEELALKLKAFSFNGGHTKNESKPGKQIKEEMVKKKKIPMLKSNTQSGKGQKEICEHI